MSLSEQNSPQNKDPNTNSNFDALSKLNMIMKCVFYWLLNIPSLREITSPHTLVIGKDCFLKISPHPSYKSESQVEIIIEGNPVFSESMDSHSALIYTTKLFSKLLKDWRTVIFIIDNSDYLFYHFHDSIKDKHLKSVETLSLGLFNSLNPKDLANFYVLCVIQAFKDNKLKFTDEIYSTISRRSEKHREYKSWKVKMCKVQDEYYATLHYESNSYTNYVLIGEDFNWDFYKFDVVKMIKDLSIPEEINKPNPASKDGNERT